MTTPMLERTPVNGEQRILTADGGNWGVFIECHSCDGTGFDTRTHRIGNIESPQCQECSGEGQLLQEWHPTANTCTTTKPTEYSFSVDTTPELPISTAYRITESIMLAAIALAFISIVTASSIRLFLWIISGTLE